jgi:hypothetical protein
LIAGLSNPSEDLQDACIQALGEIGGKSSADALLRTFVESRTERLFASSAEAASMLGIVEAAWEIIPRMHQAANPVLRRQLAIATANLIGRPGEFYRFLTGSSTQRKAEIDRCFQRIYRNLRRRIHGAHEEEEDIRRQLGTVRKMITHEQYEFAFAALFKAAERFVLNVTGATADEDLLDIAFRHDQRLGIWWWFLQTAADTAETIRTDFLAVDVLLGLYFLSVWRAEPPRGGAE